MGFFSRIKNKARKSIRTGEAPVMPRRGGFLGGMPQTKPVMPIPTKPVSPRVMDEDRIMRGPGLNPRDLDGKRRSSPPPRPTFEELLANAPSIKKVEKRGGLAGLFRRLQGRLQNRLQEQMRNQQMRAPQPIPERMPVSNVPSFNPTIFGQPIGNMDFSQMPQISPEERMAPPVMNQMQGQPRMMMSRGRDANMVDFLNSDPQQQIFGIETRIGVLENKLQEALANNDRQSYDMIVDQINDADAQIIDIKNSINPLRTSGRPELVGPRFDGFEEFITSIGPQNYGDYVGEPTLDDILSDLEKKN